MKSLLETPSRFFASDTLYVRAKPWRRGIDRWYFGSPRRHSRHSCGSPENAPWWDGPRDEAVPALAAEGAAGIQPLRDVIVHMIRQMGHTLPTKRLARRAP